AAVASPTSLAFVRAAVRPPALAVDAADLVARFAGAVFAPSAITAPTCKTARGGAPPTLRRLARIRNVKPPDNMPHRYYPIRARTHAGPANSEPYHAICPDPRRTPA